MSERLNPGIQYCLDLLELPEELYQAIIDECYRQWGKEPRHLFPEDTYWRISFREGEFPFSTTVRFPDAIRPGGADN